MPTVITRGGMSAQGFGFGAVASKLYVEDVFSTWLYTGNGSTQTITNGINLSGQGGMVWIKQRASASSHALFDTARAATNYLQSNSTSGTTTFANSLTSFNSDGFSLGSFSIVNQSTQPLVSWTFRKAPKFFDVVTYTGDGVAGRTISHNLGVAPGCIIVKATSLGTYWGVYHRSTGATKVLSINATDAAATSSTAWNDTEPNATQFTVGNWQGTNQNGVTYVAYLFAHDATAGGIIQCGSFTTDGSDNATVNLGWEPQWVLIKQSSATSDWIVLDNMRGWPVSAGDAYLRPNSSAAENIETTEYTSPNATGFTTKGLWGTPGGTSVYIAIRRGPMKTPTLGTSVFSPTLATFSGTTVTNTGFVVDMVINKTGVATTDNNFVLDRLRGSGNGANQNTLPSTSSTSAEVVSAGRTALTASNVSIQTGFLQQDTAANNIVWAFGRAPGFFDEVCYTGTGVARTINHNLGVAPELMIVKRRNSSTNWGVYNSSLGPSKYLLLNLTNASDFADYWNNTNPTSTQFSLDGSSVTNASGGTYVAYLFASCPGVSKVGSYTGTGALQTINCGFSAGARFVLIKRTDSTGDWYVWDSARGITSGNDPYLLLNSTAAEVTGTNYVDTDTTGFKVTAAAPAGINANGGSYIFLAVA